MTEPLSPAVEQLIQAQMASGHYASEEELLLTALRALEESEAELSAVQAGLDSVDRGDAGVSLDEAFEKLRRKDLEG